MNLDKFKDIKTDIDTDTDASYSQALLKLKEKKRKNILPVIGTVAAVFMALIAFTAWALIGRGVRGTEVTDGIIPASRQEISLTDELSADIDKMFSEHGILYMPSFNEDYPLSPLQIISYTNYFDSELKPVTDPTPYLTYYLGMTLNEFALKTFNTDLKLDELKTIGAPLSSVRISTERPTYHSVVTYKTEDGHTQAELTYNENTVLTYICDDITQPLYFVSKSTVGEEVRNNYADMMIFDAIERELASYDYVSDFVFYIDSFKQNLDDSYTCDITLYAVFKDADYYSVLGMKSESGSQFTGKVKKLLIDVEDGQFTVSDDQNRVPPTEELDPEHMIGDIRLGDLMDDPYLPYEFPEAVVRTALEEYQKTGKKDEILDDILLPTSLGIATPNIDPTRILPDTSNYDTKNRVQTNAIIHSQRLDYKSPPGIYSITLEDYPELENEDLTLWTPGMVVRYQKLKQSTLFYEDYFTKEQMAELERRGILLEDAHYLLRADQLPYYFDAQKLLATDDETLKKQIEERYIFNLQMAGLA